MGPFRNKNIADQKSSYRRGGHSKNMSKMESDLKHHVEPYSNVSSTKRNPVVEHAQY